MRVINTNDAFTNVTSVSVCASFCLSVMQRSILLAPVDETISVSAQKISQLTNILCMNVVDLQSLKRLFQVFFRDLSIVIVIKRRETLLWL